MADKTANPVDWFKGLSSAQQGGGGSYIKNGEYILEVVSITRKVSANPKRKEARLIIAEFRVAEVLKAGADGHAVGDLCSSVIDLDGDYPDMDLGRLNALLGSILGDDCASDAAGWAEVAARVTTPPGTQLAGERVRVVGSPKTTLKGRQITSVRFFAAPVRPTTSAAPDADIPF